MDLIKTFAATAPPANGAHALAQPLAPWSAPGATPWQTPEPLSALVLPTRADRGRLAQPYSF